MKFILRLVLMLLVVVMVSCHKKTSIREIPIANFFRNPDKFYYHISPDGKYISYLKPYQNRLNIYVHKLNSNEIIRVTSETENSVTRYWWGNNNQLIYLQDNNGDEKYRLYAVNKDGSNRHDLIPFSNVITRVVRVMGNGNILIEMNKRDEKKFDIYRLNLETNRLKMVAENPGNISFWLPDYNGKVLVAISSDRVNENLLYRPDENTPFRVIRTMNFKESFEPACFSFENNKHIYALSNINRDKKALVEIDLETGNEVKTLYEHPEVDVMEVGYSKLNKKLNWVGFTTWKYQLDFIDSSARRFYKNLTNRFPDSEISVIDNDTLERKMLIRTYSDKNPGSYYLYDRDKSKIVKLSDIAPWINTNEMADMKPISFKSRDGLTINGYLTLPRGQDARNLPVIINPHGGPWSRNKWGFNAETQFLANRGYAVLQINYRGSSGYGRKFWEASFGEWGKKMQDDVTDGVDWLIKQGIADPNRIAIYGFSYGGYSALMGAIQTPEKYRCAISYSGISNIFTYLKDIPPYYKSMQSMFYEMVANPELDADYLRDVSPIFHTDKINIPVMIVQGSKDPRVNINETNQFVKSLQKRNIEVKYVVNQNEGHMLTKEENRLKFYEELEQFLSQNMK
ncbi:Dipeptidyl aminopeptidase/acylaminoacyl peptidase [Solitalea koreensis]|uniref:Dipeptidyl aminopeptidase/acylaminoacyl peptidase n=2 Tax=Solitalea koreensis TaxID=543615 RepID=A0A521AUT7_9SPHI|nr:Dipeptidyl aminopeptidase/acylaminoacyl peptidase [Solitalea koreensis]